MWGCIAYVIDLSLKRPKCGSKGIKSIFLGYAHNSKAYRLLNLQTNSILESTSVEFFEHLTIKDANKLKLEKDLQVEFENILEQDENIIPLQDIRTTNSHNQVDNPSSSQTNLRSSKRTRIAKDLVITFYVEDPKHYKEATSLPDADK